MTGQRKLTALAGLAAAVLFTVGWLLAGFLQPASYDWSSQEISDLGALTARHAWVWNSADSVGGAFLAVFAIGLFAWLGDSRPGRIGAVLIGVVGIGSVLDGLLREDCPLSTSAACRRLDHAAGLSWHHHAHDVESVIVVVAMLVAPFLLERAFRALPTQQLLRSYTRVTGYLQLAATVSYLVLHGDTGAGIAQRLLALAFMAWICAVAISMLECSPADDPKPERRIED